MSETIEQKTAQSDQGEVYHYQHAGIRERDGRIPLWLLLVVVGLLIWSVHYTFRFWNPDRRGTELSGAPGRSVTIAIGDSLNDLSMLAVVDRPILVQKPDGSYDPEVQLKNLIRAPGVGPAGWNQAMLDSLAHVT